MKILFITAILMMGALITNCAEDRPTPHPQENSKPGSQSNKNNNAGKPGKEANKPERSPKVNKLMAQGLTEKEAVLYLVISEYRRSLGLPVLPFSKSLTVVARAHVKDSNANHPENQVNAEGVKGNLHSWSANGNWNLVIYIHQITNKRKACGASLQNSLLTKDMGMKFPLVEREYSLHRWL